VQVNGDAIAREQLVLLDREGGEIALEANGDATLAFSSILWKIRSSSPGELEMTPSRLLKKSPDKGLRI
jgi:hypothetical protein